MAVTNESEGMTSPHLYRRVLELVAFDCDNKKLALKNGLETPASYQFQIKKFKIWVLRISFLCF